MTERPYETICTDADPQWLHERTKYITASQMCVILGCEPDWWSTKKRDLLKEKRTQTPAPFTAKRNMLWGSAAEEGNMAIFAKSTGARVRSSNVMLAKKGTRISCTLDGLVFAPRHLPDITGLWSNEYKELAFYRDFTGRGFGMIEMKQSAGYKGQVAKWDVEPPDYYQIQVQTQLLVSGLDYCVIVCRLGVDDMRAHVIEPDKFLHEEMEEAAEAFWKEVGDD